MVRYSSSNTYVCDCCGRERTFCYGEDMGIECNNSKDEYYTDILISYPTGKESPRFDSHGINLCPDCAKFVIDYLKENCNDSANWPEDL